MGARPRAVAVSVLPAAERWRNVAGAVLLARDRSCTMLTRPLTLLAGPLARLGATACAAALACAAMLAASASPVAAAGASTGTPQCATSKLVIWLDTQGSGAAGSVYYHLKLTNLSGRTCTLNGYPRVAGVNLGGQQLGDASGRFVSRKRLVTLANGASATFVLQIVDVFNFSASACRPVTAAGLRVFPPGQSASKVVPFPFSACSRRGATYLWAQAVQRA